ncbi:MAG: polysaccharide deacetylase family protein [Akkermansiaceae bacterium]|nr:polysaccharide deacetylase family protein [Akkermansiaceae bacterium]
MPSSDSSNPPTPSSRLATISRRGFLALAGGSLASCAGGSKIGESPSSHIDPRTNRVIPHNPDIHVSPDFPRYDHEITHTRAMVSGKYIAMTYDDGPHPQNTPRLLRMLRERNIKATFYVIGQSVAAHPNILRQTVDEGHEIGNHTQTHRLLTKLGDDALRWEIEQCDQQIQAAARCEVRTMRPPYGALSQRQRAIIYRDFGYPTILWNVDPMDWKRPGSSVVASRIVRNTTAGSIVLAHDLHASTVSAMPSALDELLYQGYRFVTVSQLLSLQAQAAVAPAEPSPAAHS